MTISRVSDKANAVKINAFRNEARAKLNMGTCERCPICGREGWDPYQRKDAQGHAFEGCVDAFHHGRVTSYLTEWYYRPEARVIRRAELRSLEEVRA